MILLHTITITLSESEYVAVACKGLYTLVLKLLHGRHLLRSIGCAGQAHHGDEDESLGTHLEVCEACTATKTLSADRWPTYDATKDLLTHVRPNRTPDKALYFLRIGKGVSDRSKPF